MLCVCVCVCVREREREREREDRTLVRMGGDIRSCRGGGGGGSSTCVVGMLLAMLITVSVFEPVSSSARQQFFAAPGSYTYQRLDIHVTEKTTSRREDNRRSFIPASRGMSEFLPRASTSAVHDQLQTHTTDGGDGVQANLMHRCCSWSQV